MSLSSKMVDHGSDIYYSEAFKVMIEAHLNYIKKSTSTKEVSVSPKKASVYKGDLYGFLTDVGIAPNYHWIIMRLNDMVTPYQFTKAVLTLKIPDEDLITELLSAYATSNSIKI